MGREQPLEIRSIERRLDAGERIYSTLNVGPPGTVLLQLLLSLHVDLHFAPPGIPTALPVETPPFAITRIMGVIRHRK
jgi:hypothetical protein